MQIKKSSLICHSLQMNLVQYLLKFLGFLYIDWQISIGLHNIY